MNAKHFPPSLPSCVDWTSKKVVMKTFMFIQIYHTWEILGYSDGKHFTSLSTLILFWKPNKTAKRPLRCKNGSYKTKSEILYVFNPNERRKRNRSRCFSQSIFDSCLKTKSDTLTKITIFVAFWLRSLLSKFEKLSARLYSSFITKIIWLLVLFSLNRFYLFL